MRTAARIATVVGLVCTLHCGSSASPTATGDSTEALTCGTTTTWTLDAAANSTLPSHATWVGFGAQMDDKLYAPDVGGVSPAAAAALPPLVEDLGPQHARIFLGSLDMASEDYASFSDVIGLAQQAGATVNVTWPGGNYGGTSGTSTYGQPGMQIFAKILYDQIVTRHHTALKYVTIQNEVNSTKVTMPDYVTLYVHLDADLKALGIRDSVKLIAGDLLHGTLGEPSYYKTWAWYIAAHLKEIVDGFSMHIYWFGRYSNVTDNDTPLTGSGILLAEDASEFFFSALPEDERKPVYITEFGPRGYATLDAAGQATNAWPGYDTFGCRGPSAKCVPYESTIESAMDTAWMFVTAAHSGFSAALKWDMYWGHYGPGYIGDWPMIGTPRGTEWTTRPSYGVTRLLTHATLPGWHAAKTSIAEATPASLHIAAFASPDETEESVVVLNRGTCSATTRFNGVPKSRTAHVVAWNHDAAHVGELCEVGPVATGADGSVTVVVPPWSLVAVSTRVLFSEPRPPCER